MADARRMPHTLLVDHVSPATRLLETRRKLFEVQEALDAQKEEFSRKEEAFRRREEALRKKDLDLQESLIRFNKFLQENEAKRSRAEKRAADEVRARKSKQKEIEELQERLTTLRQKSAEVELAVQKNLKYMRYLESVQEETGDEYSEITGLLDRYKTLTEAHADLTARQNSTVASTEAERAKVKALRQSKTHDMLFANNQIATLKNELERVREAGAALQAESDDMVEQVSSRTRDLGQVLHAVENLLQRCTSKRHGAFLKHTITPKTEDDEGKGLGLPTRKDVATGAVTLPSTTRGYAPGIDVASMDAKQLAKRGAKAMADLRVIQAYILDFKGITSESASGGGGTAAGAPTAAPPASS